MRDFGYDIGDYRAVDPVFGTMADFDRLVARAHAFGIAFYPEFPGRDGSRTPMPWAADAPEVGFTAGNPWLPLDLRHAALNVNRQGGDPRSMLQWCRQFLA